MRGASIAFVALLSGCGRCTHDSPRISGDFDSATISADDARSDVEETEVESSAPVPPPTPTVGDCFEPKSIVRRDVKTAKETLAKDPRTPTKWHDWATDDDPKMVVRFGARTFEVTPDFVIVANEASKELWRVQATDQITGIGVTPAGRALGVQYLRSFRWELFDATTGRSLGHAQPNLLFAPADAFALETPRADRTMDEADGTYSTSVVSTWTLDDPGKATSLVTLPLKEETDDATFGAELCSTGATIVVSFPSTELAVYRAKGGAKLASIEKPGAGSPVFSRSGRCVVLVGSDGNVSALFELIP